MGGRGPGTSRGAACPMAVARGPTARTVGPAAAASHPPRPLSFPAAGGGPRTEGLPDACCPRPR
eukprot:195905-Pyramimonas_sp.AAC.1